MEAAQTQRAQISSTPAGEDQPGEDQQQHRPAYLQPLPVISKARVLAMGIEGYVIEGEVITFTTGKKYRLIE